MLAVQAEGMAEEVAAMAMAMAMEGSLNSLLVFLVDWPFGEEADGRRHATA
jgi:hypothetical protein